MTRTTRRLTWIMLALVAALAVPAAGVWAYSRSDAARSMVARQVSERLGGEVRVTNLALGLSSTAVTLELPGGDPATPFVAGTVELDRNAYELKGGDLGPVTVKDAVVTLRLNEKGDLLTEFPRPPKSGSDSAFPEVAIAGATVRFVQAGRPEFAVRNVSGDLREDVGELAIAGRIEDPELGAWAVSGRWATTGDSGKVKLTSQSAVPLTPERLRSIPFVPAGTWEAITADGRAQLEVEIGLTGGDDWTWRVTIVPQDATITAHAAAGLVVTGTTGTVVVDGARVVATGMKGVAAGGELSLDADLDFAAEPARLHFDVAAKQMDPEQLPASLGLRGRVQNGKLDGNGSVDLLVGDKVKPTNVAGKATLTGELLGGTATVVVTPRVVGDELKFEDEPGKECALPRPGSLMTLLMTMVQPPPAPEPKAPEYLKANLKLRDIDLAQLVAKANVNLPVKLAGRVTLDIEAEIPTNSPGTVRTYRAKGQVSLPALQIEGLTLKELRANVVFRDGILSLDELFAKLPPDAETPPGDGDPSFRGEARIGVDPLGDLSADLTLDRLPLGQVFAAIPGLAGKASGGVSGKFTLAAGGDKLGEVAGYDVTGELTSKSLTVYGQKGTNVRLNLALKEGVARITDSSADLYQGGVTAQATVPLVGDRPGQYDLAFRGIDTKAITEAIPDSPVSLDGRVNGDFLGKLPSVNNFDATKIKGDLNLDAPRLVVQGFPTTKLRGSLGYKPGAITYDLKGDALGGDFDVVGEYPVTSAPADENKDAPPPGLTSGKLRVRRVRLGELARELNNPGLRALQGEVTASLDYTFNADGEPGGTGEVEVTGLKYGPLTEGSLLRSPIRVTASGVELRAIAGRLFNGRVRGQVVYGFADRQPRNATVYLEDADAKSLLGLAGVDAAGRLSVRVQTSLSRETRGGATITAARASVRGVDVTDLRLPITWAVSRGGRTIAAQLLSNDITAGVAGGRVTGRAEVVYRDTARVSSQFDFVNVSVGQLSGGNGFGVGRATGRFELTGNAVRTANDLNGSLTARFGDTDVQALPVLDGILPVISPVASLTRFETGDLRARLGGGVVRVERLALNSPSAKLFAEGTVNLNGRLDLDVIYATDSLGATTPALRLIARNIPAIGPIPVGLIVRISEALANRIVRVRVAGTIDRPAYSVNTAQLLTENAIRYFTGQFTQGLVVDP